MPSYRGVDQSDIVSSINDALELLETYSIGPECQKHIDKLRTGSPAPLAAIQNAVDDIGLATAIRNSGVQWLFGRAGEVLQFHAINDTDGKGLDIVERLYKWDAGGGAMTMEYNRFDEEADSWLAAAYARRIEPSEENLEKIAAIASTLTQSKQSLGTAFNAITKLVEMGATGASDDEMKQVFLELDLHERHITRNSLSTLSALDGAEADLHFDSPMSRFGVVIDGMKERKVGYKDAIVETTRETVEKTLEPFWATDEVNMVGLGIITSDFDTSPQGIMFGGSRRAAQAVADALPGMKVIDIDGNAIAPNTLKPPPQKPGFTL